MIWTRMLAYITGTVDKELLLRNEYLAKDRQALGRKALAEVAAAAKSGTLLRWYRELIAKKSDGSRFRQPVGFGELENLSGRCNPPSAVTPEWITLLRVGAEFRHAG